MICYRANGGLRSGDTKSSRLPRSQPDTLHSNTAMMKRKSQTFILFDWMEALVEDCPDSNPSIVITCVALRADGGDICMCLLRQSVQDSELCFGLMTWMYNAWQGNDHLCSAVSHFVVVVLKE